jgi:hypothetical protein
MCVEFKRSIKLISKYQNLKENQEWQKMNGLNQVTVYLMTLLCWVNTKIPYLGYVSLFPFYSYAEVVVIK